MSFPLAAGFTAADEISAPLSAINITNHFALPGDGMLPNQLYNNLNGQPQAAQAWMTSGLMPITPEMRANGFVYSMDGARTNWLTNGARINFYTSSTTVGSFISSVTTGVTSSADFRTLTVAASAIPANATHFATNLKWATRFPSISFSSTNVIPANEPQKLPPYIMVNSGTDGRCLSDVGLPGTVESDSSAPALVSAIIVCHQGYGTYIRRPWRAGTHIVQKTTTAPEGHDANSTYQFNSVVEIPDTTPSSATPGVFLANYSAVGALATTLAVQNDCHPAYKINGMFEGGLHGVASSLVTVTAHGRTNVDRGSIWAVNGVNYMLTGIFSPDKLVFTALNTGTNTHWKISSTLLVSGTATHVSGATHTADIVFSGGIVMYLLPGVEIVSEKVWLEGAVPLGVNGAFYGRRRIQEFNYRVPNAASVLDYVAANLGSSADLNYNDPAVPRQFEVNLRWVDDAYAATVFHQVTALQDYRCDFSWPMQWQPINERGTSGNTFWFCVPASKPCAGAALGVVGDHSNGAPIDFAAWANITGGGTEYYHDQSVWADASYWSDNVQRPPWLQAFAVKDSAGNWLRKYIMARSRIMGWTADGVPNLGLAHFLSSANKSYSVTRYNEELVAGDTRMIVAGYGWMDPAFDPQADVNFTFPLNGGLFEWNWWATAPVSAYTVPKRTDILGKQVRIICNSASCAITVNPDKSVTVTTIGPGGFTALLF